MKLGADNLAVGTLFAGRHGHLKRLLEGLARSGMAPSEVVIVSMGEDLPEELPDPGAPVRSVRIEREAGRLPLSRARNEVARRATAQHLLMLDVDCIPDEALLGTAVAFLTEHDAVAMGTVRYLPPGEIAPERLKSEGAAHPSLPEHPTPGAVLDPAHFWSLVFAVRRDTMLRRIGGFDESYVGYGGEDTDFALRAQRAEVPLRWLGGPPAYHQHHETLSPPAQHLETIIRNSKLFRERWGRWPMTGWLTEFEAREWVAWEPDGDHLELLRKPSPHELEALKGS